MKYTAASLLSPEQVSEVIGLSVSTLAQWRCAGRGPGWLKIGSKVRYHSDEVDRWLDGQRREEQAHGPEKHAGEVAVPVPCAGPGRVRSHRLGGHRTKSQKGGAGGSGPPP